MLTKCDMTTKIINFATFSSDGKKVLLVKNKNHQWGIPSVSSLKELELFAAIDLISKEIEALVGLPHVEQTSDMGDEKFFKLKSSGDNLSAHRCNFWLDARFATLEEAFYILAGESEKIVSALKKLSKPSPKQ